ncbi:GntR family transcriptional regulator [Niabella beijingensis]|uniref:GntR family transcriptional regulator n=1 Tax=Niabella beijingensis TaxID=2872700 RepID=UPI001CC10544|nr:GntR family transcriptional regulator [Niabella beijingensis]MBZ4187927.1 GntR family transcriptional regulator [Niabella beijingensis]
MSIFKYIELDVLSATPKYQQLAQSIINAIADGSIRKDDILPSINELSYEFEISRDTAEKAYKHLKRMGVLGSVPGKGYFVKAGDLQNSLKIFLMFNKLSTHKKIIYDAFVKTLGPTAVIDFYIYNNDFNLFKKLISSIEKKYTHFVIITHFMEGGEGAPEIINALPKEKLILLDKLVPGVTGDFSAVYENFEEDIYRSLEKALDRLKHYETLKIIEPEYSYFPEEITNGFRRFCQQYAFNGKVVHHIQKEIISEKEVYICLMEDDLVTLVDKIMAAELRLGADVGVISYNETPLKRLILQGITTFSTDFEAMGAEAARLVLSGEKQKVAVPFHLRLRPSL